MYSPPEKRLLIVHLNVFGVYKETHHGFLDQILSVLARSSLAPETSQQAGEILGAARIRFGDAKSI